MVEKDDVPDHDSRDVQECLPLEKKGLDDEPSESEVNTKDTSSSEVADKAALSAPEEPADVVAPEVSESTTGKSSPDKCTEAAATDVNDPVNEASQDPVVSSKMATESTNADESTTNVNNEESVQESECCTKANSGTDMETPSIVVTEPSPEGGDQAVSSSEQQTAVSKTMPTEASGIVISQSSVNSVPAIPNGQSVAS